ncbi:MAG: hypothetical protein BWY99_01697 [Synergistetes bacterium ADurb.BinA166]|nr:MAG: hypothetical protein BWY99_01697 [Synergistetes bacterium ADurb.BinA166]
MRSARSIQVHLSTLPSPSESTPAPHIDASMYSGDRKAAAAALASSRSRSSSSSPSAEAGRRLKPNTSRPSGRAMRTGKGTSFPTALAATVPSASWKPSYSLGLTVISSEPPDGRRPWSTPGETSRSPVSALTDRSVRLSPLFTSLRRLPGPSGVSPRSSHSSLTSGRRTSTSTSASSAYPLSDLMFTGKTCLSFTTFCALNTNRNSRSSPGARSNGSPSEPSPTKPMYRPSSSSLPEVSTTLMVDSAWFLTDMGKRWP